MISCDLKACLIANPSPTRSGMWVISLQGQSVHCQAPFDAEYKYYATALCQKAFREGSSPMSKKIRSLAAYSLYTSCASSMPRQVCVTDRSLSLYQLRTPRQKATHDN